MHAALDSPQTRSTRAPQGSATLRILGIVIGVVASVLLLSTVFFRWDFSGDGPLLLARFNAKQFISELPKHLPWLAAFIVLSAAIIPFRAVQWQRTLPQRVPFWERYHLVAIGAFTHNAVPGKLGEGFRAFLLARSQMLPFVTVLGSVAVCKLLEFAALMSLVALSALGPLSIHSQKLESLMRVASFVCVGLVVLVLALAHGAEPAAKWLVRRQRFPRVANFLDHVHDGLGAARTWRGFALAFLASIPPVAANALGYGVALEGIGVEHGLFAGAIVLGGISLGQALPGIPVSMGVYYFVTSWLARAYGASEAEAAAFSTMTHLATVFTQVAVGGFSLWKRKIRWKELRLRSKEASHEAEVASHLPSRMADVTP